MKNSTYYFWAGDKKDIGYKYAPMSPVPDTDELAKTQRLMMRHDHDGPSFFVAEKKILYAGYVVGVIE